jgi:hypothetical protein
MEAPELEILASHWREALDAAEDSLVEVSRSRRALQFPVIELHERLHDLDLERREAELDLEHLAQTTRVPLHRHLIRSHAGALA